MPQRAAFVRYTGKPWRRSRRALGVKLALAFGVLLASSIAFPYLGALARTPVTYYLSCNGDDANDGTAPARAWRSVQRAGQAELLPGDSLLLERGCAWTGPLVLGWSGSASQPIQVAAYGTGERPVIKDAEYNVWIKGSHLLIEQLATRFTPARFDAGCDNQAVGWSIGFRFEDGAAYNTLRDVEARSLTHGVKIATGSHHNTLVHNNFADNTLMFTLDSSDPSNDSGAVGIVLDGDDNEVAYNTFVGQDACSYDFGRDGAAVEVYGGQRNVVHHNTALNNNAFSELGHARSADNTYAYNLVVADVPDAHFLVTRGAQSRLGPVLRTKVYNNTVYLTHPTSMGVHCDKGCNKDILTLKNNIIWSEGKVGYTDTRSDEANNIYWKANGKPDVFFPTPQDMNASSRKIDPLLADAAGGNFRLQANSPAINAGSPVPDIPSAAVDLDGTVVPQQDAVDIGAFEASTQQADIVLDTFGRTASGGWGAAAQGGAYTFVGEASAFDVANDAGSIVVGAPGSTRAIYLPDVVARDIDIHTQLRVDMAATESSQFAYIAARKMGNGAEYRIKLRFAPSGKVFLHATYVVGDVETDIGSEVVAPLVYVPNTNIQVRAQVVGSAPTTLKIKAWPDGDIEPIGWMYQASDSEPLLQSAGAVGLRAYLGRAHANTPVRFIFDSLRITSIAP